MAASDHLKAARRAHARSDWDEAYEAFTAADLEVPLGAADLEAWAASAYLLGRQDAFEGLLERAHQRYLDRGEQVRAAQCASWLALSLAGVGASSQASGWFARARRLLASVEERTAAHGYLDLADALAAVGRGDLEKALAAGNLAIESGVRFGDPDLTALALQLVGRVQLRRAQVAEGLALLDEAMVAVTSGALRPQAAGIVYCSVIDGCRDIYSLRRAHEWTLALTRWCEAQPELVTFTGECRVARSEMLVLHGAWHDAVAEAERATERAPRWSAQRVTAAADYQRAEVARLRGNYGAAERSYAAVAHAGGRFQPGLGLLRLAQGQLEAAEQGVERALDESSDPLRRARLLPAKVLIALAADAVQADGGGDEGESPPEGAAGGEQPLDSARLAAEELARTADEFGAGTQNLALRTMAEHALGAVALAAGDAAAAAAQLHAAADGWDDLSAPYENARARFLLGVARRRLGDSDGAEADFAAARATFERLDAAPDLAHLDRVASGSDADPFAPLSSHQAAAGGAGTRLSPRELEVLGCLAAGSTNRGIASALDISERTVDRHVSNIFDKLGVTSRTEAATYAIKHDLV